MSEGRLAFVRMGDLGLMGSLVAEVYDNLAESICGHYKSLARVDADKETLNFSAERAFSSVEVVDADTAAKKAQNHEVDILVFLTHSQAEEARAIKKAHRHVKVVIYTGHIPDDEIIWVNKRWPTNILETILASF